MRGVYPVGLLKRLIEVGPSPRAWGLLQGVIGFSRPGRSIPTCVGFTFGRKHNQQKKNGPSPRAWGLLKLTCSGLSGLRSIPTCVGFTARFFASRALSSGPSPRAWGLQFLSQAPGNGGRSIPTCVGFTEKLEILVGKVAVHPHVRGVYGSPRSLPVKARGPSPRAWGLH